MSDELKFRFATESDVPWLAKMNQQLIQDEGHRNKMTLTELEQRMSDFLQKEYEAVIAGIDFWKTAGFKEYCITLEIEN
jgi:hypothetical protein